jgi:purine-binding chemotaxis protein CheW
MFDINNNSEKKENEFVIFLISNQEYCIDIMSLREIRGWTETTALPDSPPFVKGVINLRGAVVPIVELAERLGLAVTERTERSIIMITNIGDQTVGLAADAVLDIMSIDPNKIQSPPQVSSVRSERFVNGLVAIEERMISVIDLENMLPSQSRDEAA